MSAKGAISILVMGWMMVSGCSAGLPWLGSDPASPAPEDFRRMAAAGEARGEFHQALSALRAAAALDTDDKDISRKIRSLENDAAAAAHVHFRAAMDYYKAGEYDDARRQLLTVLLLSPDHRKTLDFLKVRLNSVDQQIYRVQPGDSFIRIAAKFYKDPAKAYPVAYYNELDPEKPLLIGTMLLLPDLRPTYAAASKKLDGWMQRARQALAQKRFRKVLSLCDKIEQESPDHPGIDNLRDAAGFSLGQTLLAQKEYLEALELINSVRPGYPGREQALRRARRHQAVQEKLKTAQARFDAGAYAEAITICEAIVSHKPAHSEAETLLQASRYHLARQLLDQGEEASALQMLRTLDADYQDTTQLIALAHARLNARAEALYRKGVKYFLNEDLEMAIESWQNALALNPDHPKAREDIDNAVNLLDKWRCLEQGSPQVN